MRTYALKFVDAMVRTLTQRNRDQKPLEFEKDDDDSMTIVYTITTLRTYNFMMRKDPRNAHKYLTFYKIKE